MKKVFRSAMLIIAMILATISSSSAVTALDLDGNDYNVVLVCNGDAGDYCDKGDTVKDVFMFEDDSFMIKSFEDELFGLGAQGEYSSSGFSFNADLEVFSDDLVDKYEFDINGISLLDTLLIGSAEITYSKLSFTGYDKKDEATAYFFGIKK